MTGWYRPLHLITLGYACFVQRPSAWNTFANAPGAFQGRRIIRTLHRLHDTESKLTAR